MDVLLGNGIWMAWNTILAVIPLAFAVFLFTGERRRHGIHWWLGVVVFVAFLPNGPYVITDLMHMRGDSAALQFDQGARLLLALQYAIFVLIGVAAYAGSLELLRRYIRRRGFSRGRAFGLEVALHAMCSVGVLLGRFARFNSWEIGTRPDDILDHATSRLDRPGSWLLLLTTLAVIATATWLLRLVASGFGHVWDGINSRT